jgi:two-component system CheB/CheR fusion protein
MTSNQPSQPTAESTAEASEAEQQDDASFPIVGIAASAGGLEAFTQLLQHLSSNTGMAFVLIQHLSPDHKSLLTEILARETQMPVSEVQNGVTVEPNHVYVIPPNTKMIVSQGVLQLSSREKVGGKYMPGDAFFTSLATDCGTKAIAVVLSGGDGDGSLGLRAIKAAGGITFAQCDRTAKFNSMPNTAVATGNVDFILPPEKIAEELANLSHHPYVVHPPSVTLVESSPESEDALALVFALLRSATGVDFSHYKPSTIARRMQRRMLLYKLERLEDYADYLQDNPAEVQALYEEILIHVTSFFRDPDVFQHLKAQVFPTITQNKSADSSVRIWVAGCSTGEEVYSIAICLLEFLGNTTRLPIQIFATDISEMAIDKARAGIYQENQLVDVSPERRRSFFRPLEHGGYQISKAVRELCVFARQDLGSDPPFSNLDLVSCRNVLIYLGGPLQKRVMPVFHYSLNSTGFLLLGTSESVGQFSDLFTLVSRKSRIYAKKLTATRPIFSFGRSNYPGLKANEPRQIDQTPIADFDLQKETDQLILNRYAPVGVVINDKMDVLQLRGETNSYLRLPSGTPSLNLFNMVREDLLAGVRAAVYRAQQQDVLVRTEGLRVEAGEQSSIVNLEVIPFKGALEDRYFLVLFEASPPTSNLSPVSPENLEPGDLEREIVQLRQELVAANQERAAAQEYLQAVIQEQEGTNQELKVANEEVLSSNEELQSTNEELETAKEEIQATNEELNTTNEELRSRNQELHRANNDLINLLASINIPILMLTHDLRVRRFTPIAQKLFNFIPTDVGRPLSNIRTNLNLADLEPLILEVIDTLSPKQLEVQTQAGYWYNLRIRPYRTTENRIDGAVVMLVDIDALKRSAMQLEAARNYAEAIVETVREPLLVLGSGLKVMTANQAFYDFFRASTAETERRLIFELGNGQWNIPQLRSLLEEMLSNNSYLEDFEVDYDCEQIGRKTMLLSARRMPCADNETQMILLAITDITERKQSEVERTQLLAQEQSARTEAEAANRTKDEFLSIISHELRNPLNSMLGWSQLLRQRKLDPAKTARALEMIEQGARSQAKLIEDLLDISRITTGKLQINARQLDLASVIGAAIDVVRLSAEAKNIHIETVLDSEPVRVSGDPDRLQQVIWNLLSNAIKFTPAGGHVTVKLERIDALAQIQVSDTGQGISTDFLPYIFDRFRQADGSSTRTQGGLGLGLAIVRHLVELHGGTVHAASPGQGQGTTITVRLPLSAKSAETQPRALEPVSTVGPEVLLDSPLSLEGLRVLVVDDEAGILELLTMILEQYGAQVTAVASGEEAIAALTANPGEHDVLLSDIGMPHEDGYALIRQVRALGAEAGGQIPAAALTAYVRVEEQQESLAAGFQRHITKPVEPAQLVSIVAELAGLNVARGS